MGVRFRNFLSSAPNDSNGWSFVPRDRLAVMRYKTDRGACLPFAPETRASSRCSRFQLAFELVEKMPIGAVGNNLLRGRLNEARVAQAQRIEPQRVFGVILAPSVTLFTQRLEGIVIVRSEATIGEPLRCACRFSRA